MRTRLVGGAMALGVAVGLVGAGVVAASGGWGDDGPRPLAVLGQADARAGAEMAMSADSSAGFGGTTYRLGEGVEGPGAEAPAWSLGFGDGVEERIRDLAAALGITGEVVSEEFAWSVTEGDQRLDVQRQPGLPWSYLPTGGLAAVSSGGGSDSSAGPDTAVSSDAATTEKPERAAEEGAAITCAMPDCPPGAACAAVCPEVDPDVLPAPVPCDDPAAQCLAPDDLPEPERPADLPTAAEAEARGRELLATAGLDLNGAAVRVDDGFTSWYVTIDPALGGLPTVGMSWGAAVGGGGVIEMANGWLEDPERGDTYPLVPLADAVEDLSGMALTLELRMPCPANETCPEPEPVVLTVTGARLGLQLVSSFGAGEAFLVPSYLLEIDGGGRDSEIPAFAVAEEYLTPAPVEPVPLPEPVPGETPPSAGEPPNVGSGEPPVAEEPPVAAPSDSDSCAGATGPDGQAAPLGVEVCATSGTAGEVPVVLTVRATDPDARVRNDCGSPVVAWGDGEPTAICDIGVACGPDEPASPLETSLEHIYAQPGNYEIQVTTEAVCDDPASGSLTVAVTAVVNP